MEENFTAAAAAAATALGVDSGELTWLTMFFPVAAVLEAAVAPLMQFIDTAWPNMYWNLGYTLFVFWMYLFHAPFRVHSRARTDWYAQVTKVMQAWCGITVTVFHLAPLYLKRQFRGVQNPGVVFFPLYAICVIAFLLTHRSKRSWGMKITYAGTVTVLLLNSLLVSLFLTVHYGYCEHHEPTEQHRIVQATFALARWLEAAAPWIPLGVLASLPRVAGLFTEANAYFWPVVCPVLTFEDAPVTAVVKLSLMGLVFVMGDYFYKKIRGFDAVRGILWCDSVLSEDIPKAVPPAVVPPTSPITKAAASVSRRLSSPSRRDRHRDTAPSDGSESPVPMSFHRDQRSRVTALKPSSSVAISNDSKTGEKQSKGRSVSDQRLQPHNPPAMVPWYSTLIAHTAFQLFIGSNLNFLSFDVRGLERSITPKIFRIIPVLTPLTMKPSTQRRRNPQQDADSLAIGNSIEADELWFDWTADVGDGFNSTYEIARLLAKPMLRLNRPGRGRWGSRLGLPSLDASRQRLSQVVNRVRERGRTLQRSLKESFSMASLDALARRERFAGSTSDDDGEHGAAHSTSSAAPHPSSMRRSASAEQVRPSTRGRSPQAEPQRRGKAKQASRTTEELFLSPTVAASSMAAEAVSGSLRLQRGAFVVVGGDLAYPSPTEETYDQRLFGVYRDALGPDATLRRSVHEHRQQLHAVERADDSEQQQSVIHPNDTAVLRVIPHGTAAEFCATRTEAESVDDVTMTQMQSAPLLFAIPGNHDWIDGLSTFRNYIMGKSWLGGWHMPQRSSYFALELPANWFMICLDTGLVEDIDTEQLAYFMDVVDSKMNAESSVILVNHEPGWIYESYRKPQHEGERRIGKLSRKLGPRLRMRLCGDVHHYSRHIPRDPSSGAPALVVSGGGGAFLHGPRSTPVHHMGVAYTRACAFPAHQTVVSIATRLFGFRIVNWQFDLLGGLLYFAIVFSALPIPLYDATTGQPLVAGDHTPTDLIGGVARLTATLLRYIFLESYVSCLVCSSILVVMVGIIEDKMPLYKRLPFGLWWGFLHILSATTLIALLHCLMSYAHHSGMVESGDGRWASSMERQVTSGVRNLVNATATCAKDAGWNRTSAFLDDAMAATALRGCCHDGDNTDKWPMSGLLLSVLTRAASLGLKAFDVVEGLTYLALNVAGPTVGVFRASCTRIDVLLYYAHATWFYWILATPVVSFVVGAFLLVSVSITDTAYDAAYSAFQIEDFKHFLRFRLDRNTRMLKVFAIGVDRVPKVWERDERHDIEEQSCAEKLPPHLRRYPSVWKPSSSLWRVPGERGYAGPRIIDEFDIAPTKAATTSSPSRAR